MKDKGGHPSVDSHTRLITARVGLGVTFEVDYTIYIGNNPISKD